MLLLHLVGSSLYYFTYIYDARSNTNQGSNILSKKISNVTNFKHTPNIGTKCNSLTQQFVGISTTIDTWVTCFDSIESSSGPQRLQIQFLQGSQMHCGIPNAYIIQ